jgi:diaminopimelate decarboxylase
MACEQVSLRDLAERVGTPFYCYSASMIERQYRLFADALAAIGGGKICYAVKANSNLAIIATLARLGAGADVVSEGEARRAIAAGVKPADIVFSGVGKTEAELIFAVEHGIGQVNLESERDLEVLSAVAAARGAVMRIGIRVNPDIDAGTHAKISTGKAENKFGIDIGRAAAVFTRAASLPGIDPAAVAVHIGSQLLDMTPYEGAFRRVAALVRELREQGVAIRHLDLGGGIGVPYRGETKPDLAAYTDIIARTVGDLGCALMFEPGRFLVAEAGVLVSRVIDVKRGATKTFLVQDAAMTELIRPTLYEAYHPILPVEQPSTAELEKVDVVGPVCETGDFLATDRPLPPQKPGALLAVTMAGAYGAVMGSTYNTRPLPPEILVSGHIWSVIRERQSLEALIGLDRIPDWLESPAKD